jgi:hypothetical protein
MTHTLQTFVRPARRVVVAVAALLPVLLAPAPAPALAARMPAAETTPAIDVTDTTATLTAVIGTDDEPVSYRFTYESAFSARVTGEATLPGDESRHPVAVTVAGLTPDTPHTFHVEAWRTAKPDRRAVGAPMAFRTAPAAVVATQSAPAAAPPAAALAPPAPAPALAAPVTAAEPPPPSPELGQSVVVLPVSGTVTVQVPGASGFAPLSAASSVPVGAVLDTRQGAVRLTSALPGGTTQTGEFHGSRFEVRQSNSARGTTELRLRGGNFAVCARSGARAGAAAVRKRSKPPVRRLWSRDTGGRFLTRGRNSVATVRGTRWVTTDTCAGTRTTVTSGAVAVRDLRRKRTVLVRAGHSYLARSRR